MKSIILSVSLLLSFQMKAQQITAERFSTFPFGSVRPTGWIREQMQKDVEGFVGNLDILVPDLINDPIYGKGRLQKHSQAKSLGNLKSGDAEGDEQYKWWNSETQSNWWDGYLRNVLLLQDAKGKAKVKQYISNILSTQDDDGYLGIYDRELRYHFSAENGELWSKASLYRGLLAYYEFTGDDTVLRAVSRAVDNVMQHYPINASSPFSSGNSFNGGVSHGLTFTDILERMFYYTHDAKYRQYALFLYKDFSSTYQSECDVQLKNILDPEYKLRSHGVHTFEHIRPLIVAAYAAGTDELSRAMKIYLQRIKKVTTISGGPIGDEWIAARDADATSTGYEYCSIQELLDSYGLLLQKTGDAQIGDAIENIFYNAAQGSRDPDHSCIAYLKTDNSYEMTGTKNGEAEPNRKQTRYKYSPAHQDIAVCCNPNAGRITPYFLQYSWMKENDSTLVATLLAPGFLETIMNGKKIRIENLTQYPYEHTFHFGVDQEKASVFTLKIRKPAWATKVITNENYVIKEGFVVIERSFSTTDAVDISFDADIQIRTDDKGGHYFSYGALLFAKPITAREIKGRSYAEGFFDYTYEPVSLKKYVYCNDKKPVFRNGTIITKLISETTGRKEKVQLLPIGKTILRQTTF